jgi:fructose-1,6-bisphosphatase
MNNMARPSTSAGAFMRKKEDMMMLESEDFMALQESAQDDFDKELDAMIMKN